MDNPELAAWIEMAYPKLLVYAKYQTFGDIERAQELLQTTLTKVIEGRIKLDLTRAPLTAMQFALRTTQRELMPDQEIIPTMAGMLDREPELDQLLECLEEAQQELVRGRLEGQTWEELGCQYGVSYQTIQQRYQVLIRRVRKWWTAHGPGGSTDGRAHS